MLAARKSGAALLTAALSQALPRRDVIDPKGAMKLIAQVRRLIRIREVTFESSTISRLCVIQTDCKLLAPIAARRRGRSGEQVVVFALGLGGGGSSFRLVLAPSPS